MTVSDTEASRQPQGPTELSFREIVTRTFRRAIEHELPMRAAAIAYYAFSALIPFLGVVLTIALTLLPNVADESVMNGGTGEVAVGQLRHALAVLLPREAFLIVARQISRLQSEPPIGMISLGIAISLWLASAVYQVVISTLNYIFDVTETRPTWKLYLIAVGMTFIEAVILLASAMTVILWPQVVGWLGLTVGQELTATVVKWIAVVCGLLLSFALGFRTAVNDEDHWAWITPGSVLGTLLFVITCLLFRLYVQNFSSFDKTYGSLGGVMVLLTWLWLMSLIFLLAAELNSVIRDTRYRRQDADQ